MVLDKFPHLESLAFDAGIRLTDQTGLGFKVWNSTPSCFFSSLEDIEFYGFDGSFFEVYAVFLLLAKAIVLESLTVSSSEDFKKQPEKLNEIKKALETVPRASLNCFVVLTLRESNHSLSFSPPISISEY